MRCSLLNPTVISIDAEDNHIFSKFLYYLFWESPATIKAILQEQAALMNEVVAALKMTARRSK